MDNGKDIEQIEDACECIRQAQMGATQQMLAALNRRDETRFALFCNALVKLHGALESLYRAVDQPPKA